MLREMNYILNKKKFSRSDIVNLLSVQSFEEQQQIFTKAREIRDVYVGNNIHLRGLIEFSNKCRKNCLYCGVRGGNQNVNRYQIPEEEVLDCARYALKNNYGSIVIQSGERINNDFVDTIDGIIKKIKKLSNGNLGITLSCGEQSEETYHRWYQSGAHRYLLRIESSNLDLYNNIHPQDNLHYFGNRIIALNKLRNVGYQVGSGIMIGLPNQTVEDLADDLIFLQKMDVDMVGMGPYIEHPETPLYTYISILSSKEERLRLSLLMIAVLRIMMKDINIASATALDSLHPDGRILAIRAGANVLMPNLTPVKYRENYFLYKNKPHLLEANELIEKMKIHGLLFDSQLSHQLWGDSKHYLNRRILKKMG